MMLGAIPKGVDWAGPAIIGGVVAFVVAVFAAVWLLSPASKPRPVAMFMAGEQVRMVAFGHEGMVIRTSCGPGWSACLYDVRFAALQARTDVSLLGRDGPITLAPVALVRGIREFELERAR